MYRSQEKDEEYLKNKLFVGIVEDNIDPKRIGRIKVRVQGVFNNIELEHIPWSIPFQKSNGTDFKIPANGKIVNIIFPQGNLYFPEYIYSENYNINLQNKLKDLKDDEYKNFVALLFDHRTQVYSDDTALNLDYFDNAIRIKKDSVDIKLKDNTQLLKLGHSNCSQDAVLGTNFFKWFDSFMTLLLQPETLTGNLLAPVLRPALDLKIQEYHMLRSTFVSNNVKIVDNGDISKDEYDTSRLENPAKDDFCKINDNKLLAPSPEPTIKKLQDNIITDRKVNITEKVENEPQEEIEILIDNNSGYTSTNANKDENYNYSGDIEYTNANVIAYYPEWDYDKIREDKIESKVSESIQGDPYAGFWEETVYKIPNNLPKEETDGYGTYVIENDTSSIVGESASKNMNELTSTRPNLSSTQLKNIDIIIDECKKQGITNEYAIAGILGTIYKECSFIPQTEMTYHSTPAAGIRSTFGSGRSVSAAYGAWLNAKKLTPKLLSLFKDKKGKTTYDFKQMSDKNLETLSKELELFYDCIYGWYYGNSKVGDGYKYRGRGFNQITFKDSYTKYGFANNPDGLNDPKNAAIAAIKFFKNVFSSMPLINESNPKYEDKANYSAIQKSGSRKINDIPDIITACVIFIRANAGGKGPLTGNSVRLRDYKTALSISDYMLELIRNKK
ncbi:hypothetical protein M0Q97_07770 [Candidatus Dojkabacteria bacterium]|jgi:hypothetical protein|nr:hypothetical protein [Candidatus Dojkabacteria bacterium]